MLQSEFPCIIPRPEEEYKSSYSNESLPETLGGHDL